MNITEFLTPGFLLSFVVSIIGFIVWLVRLEGKTSANSQKIDELKADRDKHWTEFETHRMTQDIHFNIRTDRQVEEKHNQRFVRLEAELHEIKSLVMRLLERK